MAAVGDQVVVGVLPAALGEFGEPCTWFLTMARICVTSWRPLATAASAWPSDCFEGARRLLLAFHCWGV